MCFSAKDKYLLEYCCEKDDRKKEWLSKIRFRKMSVGQAKGQQEREIFLSLSKLVYEIRSKAGFGLEAWFHGHPGLPLVRAGVGEVVPAEKLVRFHWTTTSIFVGDGRWFLPLYVVQQGCENAPRL